MRPRVALFGILLFGLVPCGVLVLACTGSRPPVAGADAPAATAPAPPAPSALAPPPRVEFGATQARRVLDRLAFGPVPGQVNALVAQGLPTWLEQQLAREREPSAEVSAALQQYQPALLAPAALSEAWLDQGESDEAMSSREVRQRIKPFLGEHLATLATIELTRQVLSPWQLEEVMVDFWVNHFSVYAPKDLLRVLAGDYVERVIRAHALGRFEDLLLATAEHPAMLLYLDNASNVGPRSKAAGPKPGALAGAPGKRRGLNENYARELLELHTLGVDGGYSQQDVSEVARIFTGWSFERPGKPNSQPFEFVFRESAHDRDAKRVLGVLFEEGRGIEEGERLLALLANHPHTARHLARKLCMRFVAEVAPEGCVSAVSETYLQTRGDLRQVMRRIASTPEFWQGAGKLKTPHEFLVSSLRALNARPDGTTQLAKALKALGEPWLEQRAPTGYPEAGASWASSSGLLGRMNLAVRLAFGKQKGVVLSQPLEELLGEASDPAALVQAGNRLFLTQAASEQTLSTIMNELGAVSQPAQQRALAVALFLGSPEFQYQ